ncbi:hypothetical protein P43SY_008100 [Pythium insidiosum]|uniref:Uncharacterized protein n=1 Tax=Pythium insidiosum TaxID=114742 RepID=A0AAD5Q397_PYTIN|nr:hypothetical protein P43SY_008100 [Pythium insidiosum]
MPWETGSAVSGAPGKRNVGVLEVKMKQRLQHDARAVAIGAVHRQSPDKKKARKVHRLPALRRDGADDPRPPSFELERERVMNAVELPSPTRSVIERHVEHAKHIHERELAQLPPIAGAFKKRTGRHATGAGAGAGGHAVTLFPQAYQRGELPIMIESKAGGNTIRWTQDIKLLDFSKYFPLFIEGIREPGYPFSFLAREGTFQLLAFGQQHPERVLDCLQRVVIALRSILETRDPRYLRDALQVLQLLTQTPGVGPALVPFYRQLLPVINAFKSKRRNLGDDMDFLQHKVRDLGELILETLELLEATGGPDAFVNIKYMVPTYEGARIAELVVIDRSVMLVDKRREVLRLYREILRTTRQFQWSNESGEQWWRPVLSCAIADSETISKMLIIGWRCLEEVQEKMATKHSELRQAQQQQQPPPSEP